MILVAGQSRLAHRHPLPTDAALGRRAMLVVCGRRHGLIANATRWVGASDPGEEAILRVEAAFFDATRPGARLDEVFAAGTAGVRSAGLRRRRMAPPPPGRPDGLRGPRSPGDSLRRSDLVQEHHAFAWNPSAPGVKVEDTVLATSAGIEVLTVDPRWPTVRVGALDRPATRPY